MLTEGITHIEDLDVDAFIRTVKGLASMHASEKLDGANLWFGIDEAGKFFTSREGKRKGQRFYSVDDYALISAYNQFRAAHLALQEKLPDIQKVLAPGDMVEIEVLYGRQPNAVTYGAGGRSYIAFLRGVEGTSDVKVDQLAAVLNNQHVTVKVKTVDSVDGERLETTDSTVDFQFVSVQKLDTQQLQKVNVNKQLAALEKFLKSPSALPNKPTNYEVLTSSLGSFDKEVRPQAKQLKAELQAKVMSDFKLPIKKQLLDEFVKKLKSPLSSDDLHPDEDIGIEGVVLKDPVSGEQIKLVDKDTFTTINAFNHSVKSKISGVIKTVDMDAPIETRGGIVGELRILISDLLGNRGLARTSEAKKVLAAMKGKTPEDTIRNLSKELKITDDYRSTKRKVVALIDAAVMKVKELREQFKTEKDNYQLKLKGGKSVGLSPEAVRRTMTAFAEAQAQLMELRGKVEKTKGQVQLVALLWGKLAKDVYAAAEEPVTEGTVIKGSFGKHEAPPEIQAPPGFDRFEADGRKIIGIKGEKRKVVGSTSDERLARALAQAYNGGKTELPLKPVSLLKAFGSDQLNIARDIGVKLYEKPSYFEDLEQLSDYQVSELQVKRLERELKKHGHQLKTYTSKDIWGGDPSGPLKTVKLMPTEDMALVKFDSGKLYLVDTTGASTYIRMWAKVNKAVSEELLHEKRIFTDKALYAGKDAWTIFNIYFSTYMMAAVIIKANDMPGIRLLRDKTHMRLKSWSKEMSAFNFWGYPIWRSSSPAVKKLVGPKTAKDIYKVVRHVPIALWRLMHIDMSFGKEVPIEWADHRKVFWLLQKHPGLMVDRINNLFDGVLRYEELTHDEKIKLHEKLYYYVMQFNQNSPLLTRVRVIYNNLLNNPNDANQQLVQEMKLLKSVTALSEEGEGGEAATGTTAGATASGAVSNYQQPLFGEKRMIHRIKRTNWKPLKFPNPNKPKEQA